MLWVNVVFMCIIGYLFEEVSGKVVGWLLWLGWYDVVFYDVMW